VRGGVPIGGHESWVAALFAERVIVQSDRFLNSDEAAVFLGGINSRTLTRWAREGYVPAYPVGEGKRRLWRFLERDLEVWMLARRTGEVARGRVDSCAAIGAPVGGV